MKHDMTGEGRRVLAEGARTRLTHGEASRSRGKTPEYRAWANMFQRCENRKNRQYPQYGGRGVTICPRWRESFLNFLADMGRRPTPSHSIDRIDNSGNYEPSNCRWATQTEQCRNKRNNVLLTINGETLCMAAWAQRVGLSKERIYWRLKHGWTPETAVLTPLSLPIQPKE